MKTIGVSCETKFGLLFFWDTLLHNSKFSLLLERCLVEVTKLNLGQDSEARFGQDFKFKFSRDTDVGLRF